jgi:hypothetical protein
MVPNVVGMVTGSDPELSQTYVVQTAHFDHVGVGPPDETGDSIYNGADDNASGTSALLQVAAAFAALPEPPARSVIFLAVSGEEKGLLGSRYWVDHPTVPLDGVVANVNMDMVGRNDPDTVYVIGDEYTDMGEWTRQIAAENPQLRLVTAPDPDGYVTIVVSDPAHRPDAAIDPEAGVHWLPWGPFNRDYLLYRMGMPDPDWEHGPRRIPEDAPDQVAAAQEVMAEFYPVARYCDPATILDHGVAAAEPVAVLDHVVVGVEAEVAVVGVPEELHPVEQDPVGLLGVETVLGSAADEEVAPHEPVGAVDPQDQKCRILTLESGLAVEVSGFEPPTSSLRSKQSPLPTRNPKPGESALKRPESPLFAQSAAPPAERHVKAAGRTWRRPEAGVCVLLRTR